MGLLRALLVGTELAEIRALRDAAAGLIDSSAEVIAVIVGRNAAGTTIAGSKPIAVYELTADNGDDQETPIEQSGDDTDVCAAVADVARRHDVDVIVVAGRRPTWLQRVASGSAAGELLRCSSVPILAMPGPS